ncbi:MAG: hypothetical protein E6337_08525 [Ligilactobacillus salivarius]|jgi:hypothetical protein|nr:hypothetical protein [Ligilactobacillus salivarius]
MMDKMTTKFVGTIEFLDSKGNETNLRVLAILNSINDEIISAIPIEIFEGGNVTFHQTIENNEFKVISIDGDKIDDMMSFISSVLSEDETESRNEITLDDFVSAEE